MRVLDIIEGTVVDGVGLRTSIYFAGCTHHCPGCHNPQSWNPDNGHEMSVDEILEQVREYGLGLNIWCYTGYTIEEIEANDSLRRIFDAVDVIVEGRYVSALRDIHLPFRGSSNQRIVESKTRKNISPSF